MVTLKADDARAGSDVGEVVPGVSRIAVLRANGVGDLVFTLPALEALRAAYPDAEITLLGQPLHAELFAGRPAPFDRVLVVPHYPGVHPAEGPPAPTAEVARFFAAMRATHFDLALQLHGGGHHSNPFVRGLGARVTAGFRAPGAPSLDRWVRYVYFQPEVLRYLEVVGLVGARPVTVEPRITVVEEDLRRAERLLHDVGADVPLVAVDPAAGDPRRRWPPDRFSAVADALAADGARIVLVGAPADAAVCDEVRSRMHRRDAARSLAGRTGLSALLGVLARADLLVANDTGPLHLAAAVGTATVGVYWCGNLVNAGPPTTNRHRAVASWRTVCPCCGEENLARRCPHDDSFVADVGVEDVVDQARDLLGGPAGVRR